MAMVHALGLDPEDVIIVDDIKYTVDRIVFDVFKSVLFCTDENGQPKEFTYCHDTEVELFTD